MCLANSIDFVQVFSVDFFVSKQTVSPFLDKILTLGIENKFSLLSLNRIFRGDGREVRNEGLVFGYYRPPLSPPKVGRTGLSAS